MTWQTNYMQRYYVRRPNWRDGTTEFHEMCREHIPTGTRILEIGSGPSNATTRFLATLGELHGVDVAPDARSNDGLRSFSLIEEGGRFSWETGAFGACVSNYVLEHVANPLEHLQEVQRVLRPGGVYLFRTPNRFHYVAMVSSMTPHAVHELLANRLRGLGDGAHEPYPTFYRLNSRRAIRRHAERAGLQVVELRMVEKEPSYGMASRALFLSFMAYERFVNSTELSADLRSNVFGVLKKPAGAG